MVAKQVQSNRPASWFLDRRLHPACGSGSLSEAALNARQGWEPRSQAHRRRLAPRHKPRREAQGPGNPGGGGGEAGAKSFREQRGSRTVCQFH